MAMLLAVLMVLSLLPVMGAIASDDTKTEEFKYTTSFSDGNDYVIIAQFIENKEQEQRAFGYDEGQSDCSKKLKNIQCTPQFITDLGRADSKILVGNTIGIWTAEAERNEDGDFNGFYLKNKSNGKYVSWDQVTENGTHNNQSNLTFTDSKTTLFNYDSVENCLYTTKADGTKYYLYRGNGSFGVAQAPSESMSVYLYKDTTVTYYTVTYDKTGMVVKLRRKIR